MAAVNIIALISQGTHLPTSGWPATQGKQSSLQGQIAACILLINTEASQF